MLSKTLLAGALLALIAPLAAHAQVSSDGLLSEPPANAKAGQCFAKVVVPGQPVYGPPSGPHLKWVQSPPPPGAVGPVWCQVWDQGYEPTVTYTPERYGWIRVICDHDATPDKIGHIQRRLHDWGVYQGGYDGKYDAATSAAVARFQETRGIKHGGYLSYQTMEALDAAPSQPEAAPPVAYVQNYAASGYAYQQSYAQQTYVAPTVYQPVYQQPTYQQPAPCQPMPQPCGPAPCPGGQGGHGQGGYGQPAFGAATWQGGRRWLTWAGKSGY